jgi:hypothetical protein
MKINFMHKFYLLLLSFFLIVGCDSEEPDGSTSNQIKLNNKSNGFSFSKGLIIPQSDSATVPDIQVYANRSGNTIIGVNLFSPGDVRSNFLLINEFNNSDSALIFFTNLSEVPDSNYTDTHITIKENQIWAIRTGDNKFAKILIDNTDAHIDSTSEPGIIFFYAEVIFKWKYQPDGSRYF